MTKDIKDKEKESESGQLKVQRAIQSIISR
jgi:hypothetical protein